jgi:hypothetical protein
MNDLELSNEFTPALPTANTDGNMAVEASRAAQEVMGLIISSKRFPRDEFTVYNKIVKACERYSLAKAAEYVYPRGDTTVKGPTIRLAEVCAQVWGNMDFGIKELDRNEDAGWSDMEAYCWDLEYNTRRSIKFRVEHIRDTKKGSRRLTDQRDIYEITANQAARRVRSCILSIIPGDIIEKAMSVCRETLKKGDGRRLEDQLKDMIVAFAKLGVPQEAIEKKLNHRMEIATKDELVDMIGIYNSIKDNLSSRFQFFDIAGSQTDDNKNLNEKILGKGETK